MKRIGYEMLALIAVLVIALDQFTKKLVATHFQLHQSVPIIPNFFDLVYVRNKGAAFGILADTPYRVLILLVTTSVAVGFLVWLYRQFKPDQVLARCAVSLVLGGALGNLIDRLRFGEVVDFIYVHWFEHYWPAFNVADSAICVGVGLLLLAQWRDSKTVS